MFAQARARVKISEELTAAGVPDTHLQGGFDYDGWVEIEHAGHINDERIANPPGSYIPADIHRGLSCVAGDREELSPGDLHLAPEFGIAYRPDACRGPAPFAPVSYFRWLGFREATLYVVKFGPR